MTIANQLGALRRLRGIGATELAKRVGVSRQTVHAIEAGSYVPNTEVALRLARELEVSVEELFALKDAPVGKVQAIRAELLSEGRVGGALRVAEVNGKRVGVPVDAAPYYLPEADGLVSKVARGMVEYVPLSPEEAVGKRVVIAGCDPAIGLLARMVEKVTGVEVVAVGASSKLALRWLMEGRVHVAGSHLEDEETGEFNLPYLRREHEGEDLAVVSFAEWEEGFVVGAGNPKGVGKVEDLGRRGVRFVNREKGSGSRGLVDRLLLEAGMDGGRVRGYEREEVGHLAVAYQVMKGEADCGVATRAAARVFGLDFVALKRERYDFVMRREIFGWGPVESVMEVLQRASLRRKLEGLAGYDTARTGAVLA